VATARAATPEEGLDLRERALLERLRPDGAAPSAPALVFLENVERDLPLARLLETVAPLGITTLLTSRSEPASPRVHLLRLEVLPSDAGTRLFAERNMARGGTWVAERDAVATRAIVDGLGGLPLAIELAAAQTARGRLSLTALAEELRSPDVLARLTDPLDHSASVRYSLSKTLAELSPSQRMRFAALGLPEGPDWPLSVIEQMFAGVPAAQADTSSAQADLEALIAYSLVGVTGDDGTGQSRVRLHPLVRELAREEWAQLSEANRIAALQALLAGAQEWLALHARATNTSEFAENARALAQDEAVIVGAIRRAVAYRTALPQVSSLVEAWSVYTFLASADLRLERELRTLQLESARIAEDRVTELTALSALARASGYLGHADEATRYYQEALALARELGDPVRIVHLLSTLGSQAANRGARVEAERQYDEANAIARELGAQLRDVAALNALGSLAQALGHLSEAEHRYRQALECALAERNPAGLLILHNLGFLYEEQGDLVAAHEAFDAIAALQRIVDRRGEGRAGGVALNALGQLALQAGDLEGASHDFAEALTFLEDSGMAANILQVRGNLALLAGLQAQRQGEREAAEQAFEEA
jgi:tetratricopeptide (TPR) repeat protein